MKPILIYILPIFFIISGCQSAQKKEYPKENKYSQEKILKEKYKNAMNVKQQNEIFFYADSIRDSCGGIYLSYSEEIGDSNRKKSLKQEIENITSKYKNILSKKVKFTRPSYSPVYGSNVLDAFEKSSDACRIALLNYIEDINLAFFTGKGSVDKIENVLDFFIKETRLYASSYAFEYNTYSYSGNALKFSMGEYTNLMYTYYSFLNKMINKIKDPSSVSISESFNSISKQKNNLEKDFDIISGLVFFQKIDGKSTDKFTEEKIKSLRETFLLRTDFYYSSILEKYNALSGKNADSELGLDSYLSMYIDVAIQEKELAPKVREYQELMLNVLTFEKKD